MRFCGLHHRVTSRVFGEKYYRENYQISPRTISKVRLCTLRMIQICKAVIRTCIRNSSSTELRAALFLAHLQLVVQKSVTSPCFCTCNHRTVRTHDQRVDTTSCCICTLCAYTCAQRAMPFSGGARGGDMATESKTQCFRT